MTAERIGVLGGTFDPVHLGHLLLGETAREQAQLDRVIFVPTGHSWRKPDRVITPGSARGDMLNLAVKDNPFFEVSMIEVDRPGPSYTHETLDQLARDNPGAGLFFILGHDALADLPNWRDPARILRLATLVLAAREAETLPQEEDPALKGSQARLLRLQMPTISISATDVRHRVAAGRSIRYLVPAPVAAYIQDRRLYQAQ
jgi:nicotinate-nucleotide adenylyltransferase